METIITNEDAPLAGEAKVKQLFEVREKYKGDTGAEQGIRLLEALRLFSISTIEARRYLDIMHPAGRIQELRDADYEIVTHRLTEKTEIGRAHCIAVYVLLKEAQP